MKGERFDQKTGKWVPKPEEQEAPTVKKEVNINVHLKGKRYNSDTGGWEPIPENSESDVAALRAIASKLAKELSDPEIPVEQVEKMRLEYAKIKKRLGEAIDGPGAGTTKGK